MSVRWFYKIGDQWQALASLDSKAIEEEYKEYIDGYRTSQRVYHCFGWGGSACINFNSMTTYCSSMKCFRRHSKRRINDDHLSFLLKRERVPELLVFERGDMVVYRQQVHCDDCKTIAIGLQFETTEILQLCYKCIDEYREAPDGEEKKELLRNIKLDGKPTKLLAEN